MLWIMKWVLGIFKAQNICIHIMHFLWKRREANRERAQKKQEELRDGVTAQELLQEISDVR